MQYSGSGLCVDRSDWTRQSKWTKSVTFEFRCDGMQDSEAGRCYRDTPSAGGPCLTWCWKNCSMTEHFKSSVSISNPTTLEAHRIAPAIFHTQISSHVFFRIQSSNLLFVAVVLPSALFFFLFNTLPIHSHSDNGVITNDHRRDRNSSRSGHRPPR